MWSRAGLEMTPELTQAIASALVLIIPITAQLVVSCLRRRLEALEAKLDRNTRITERALVEARSRGAQHRAEDSPQKPATSTPPIDDTRERWNQ
jgi:uncharacterized membrane protein